MQRKKEEYISVGKSAQTPWVFVCLGIALLLFGLRPLYPQIHWYVAGLFETSSNDDLLSFAVSEATSSTTPADGVVVSSTMKRLIIPSIGVDMEIVDEEGISEEDAFLRGAWLLPRTSMPNRKTGNTVIAAHRFLYTSGPNTFYHLDKLKEGDDVIVEWQGERFVYTVTGSRVVPPTAVEILTPTEEPILTLFTCTPVFTTKNRLVVTAQLSTEE